MKYCARCGTQIPDGTMDCPNCNPPINNTQYLSSNQQHILEKKIKNLYIVIPISIFVTALIMSAITCFTVFSILGSENISNNNSGKNTSVEATNTTCPADEYGNHSWEAASCVRPSYCWNCGENRDNTLGNHHFHYDEDIDEVVCYYCHIFKSKYDNQE